MDILDRLRKIYHDVQTQADVAARAADMSRYQIEHRDLVRAAQRLNVAASQIHAAITEIETAYITDPYALAKVYQHD